MIFERGNYGNLTYGFKYKRRESVIGTRWVLNLTLWYSFSDKMESIALSQLSNNLRVWL